MKGLEFKIGVPETLNHIDPLTAVSPLNYTDMHWHWASGYKFFRAGLVTFPKYLSICFRGLVGMVTYTRSFLQVSRLLAFRLSVSRTTFCLARTVISLVKSHGFSFLVGFRLVSSLGLT